ncbi:unnamed protein product [Rhodiola kirilowii]
MQKSSMESLPLMESVAMDGEVEDESSFSFSCSSSDLFTSETTGVGEYSGEHCYNRVSSPSSKDDLAEMEMVKERLSKLLLGEDMSGSGNGVHTALAISNAITNLSASVFGQMWRLEPLPQVRKSMWRREMECLLCVTNYIVEFKPSWHTYPDGSQVEVMSTSPRPDLAINLPALRKLDSMLLEVLDCFTDPEFWYIEQGLESPDALVPSLLRKDTQRQEEKWWLPVPQVPACGLHEDGRKMLQNKHDCTNQILKAVTATNNMTLADMEIPESYLEGLPKHARDCLGDIMYRYMSSNKFSPERLLADLRILSEHQALEIASQVEATIIVCRRRTSLKDIKRNNHNSRALIKDLALDAEKRELIAARAVDFLHCLKQKFPGLSQTALDTSKIQHNKDVGKAILESYSRVLESLAFNTLARIDDILRVDDDTARHSNQKSKSFFPKVLSFGHGKTTEKHTSVSVPNTGNKITLAEIMTSLSHMPLS